MKTMWEKWTVYIFFIFKQIKKLKIRYFLLFIFFSISNIPNGPKKLFYWTLQSFDTLVFCDNDSVTISVASSKHNFPLQ